MTNTWGQVSAERFLQAKGVWQMLQDCVSVRLSVLVSASVVTWHRVPRPRCPEMMPRRGSAALFRMSEPSMLQQAVSVESMSLRYTRGRLSGLGPLAADSTTAVLKFDLRLRWCPASLCWRSSGATTGLPKA